MDITQVSYQITESADGVSLRIWEPSNRGKTNQPYSFMANYTVSSVIEAQRILQSYCSTGINVSLRRVG